MENNTQTKKNFLSLDANHCLGCFVLGFFGLILISTIFATILKLFDLPVEKLSSLCNFFTYALLFAGFIVYLWKIKALKPLLKNFNPDSIGFGIVMGIVLIVGTIIVGAFFQKIGDILGVTVKDNNNQELVEQSLLTYPVFSILMTCVFAPIIEELAYRAGLFGAIYKKNKILAYIVSSCFFALLHFDVSSTNMANELLNLPSYLFAGFTLTYAYEKNGDISSSIIAHALNNTLSVVMILGLSIG